MMSSRASSFSNFSSTYSGEMDEGKLRDDSNGTKYDSYPTKNRKQNIVRSHLDSQNEGVLSALATLQSKLQLLHQDKDSTQNLRSSLLSINQNSKLEASELPWIEELADVESKCHSLQTNLLDMLKVIQSEKNSDLLPTSCGSIHSKESREIDLMNLRSINLQLPLNDHEVNGVNKTDIISKQRKRGPSQQTHHTLTTKQLPFVLSGMTGKSFSLPVNIQLLVASLKSHHPWMCSLASDISAMQELISQVENDLKDTITSLKDSISHLTLESCNMRNRISLTMDMQAHRVRHIMNRRDTQIAHMCRVDTLLKQLDSLKKHLNFPQAVPSATTVVQKRQTSNVDSHAEKRKRSTAILAKNRSRKMKTSTQQKMCANSRPPWNDRVTPDVKPPQRPSVNSIKYRELLQVALKRNGFKLRERED